MDEAEARCESAEAKCAKAEAELRAKVSEAVEARGRMLQGAEALQQQQQQVAAREVEHAGILGEQQARCEALFNAPCDAPCGALCDALCDALCNALCNASLTMQLPCAMHHVMHCAMQARCEAAEAALQERTMLGKREIEMMQEMVR